MILVENNNLIPQLNHAIELYLMDNFDEDIFMFWRNRPSILIGRFQNLELEVNTDYTTKNNIDIVRRLSGGGAIYCDEFNMQYTFITKKEKKYDNVENTFRYFADPIVEALQSLGINAQFKGRNDILIDDCKISGNAQFHKDKKVIHHGTLLFKANLENISNALNPREIKLKKHGVKSVRSRIGFIGDYTSMNVQEFMDYIKNFMKKKYNIVETYNLTEEEMKKIKKIQEKIFDSEDWTNGNKSLDKLRSTEKYSCGIVEIILEIEEKKIKKIFIEGDFFSEKDIEKLYDILIGTEIKKEILLKKLENVEIDEYIKGMNKEDLIKDIIKLSERVE